jgi:hypothetical protein
MKEMGRSRGEEKFTDKINVDMEIDLDFYVVCKSTNSRVFYNMLEQTTG